MIERPELHLRLARWSGASDFQAALALLSEAEVVIPDNVASVCRDPKDDKYFACAAAGDADYIVSADEDMLAIPEYTGVRTIRAAAFLRVLDAEKR